MKKYIFTLFISLALFSCLDEVENSSQLIILPIESYETPTSFTFGETDTIRIKYQLPNSCISFRSIYYQTQDSVRLIAVNALEELGETCNEIVTEKDAEIIVRANQRENYLLRFFKGVNSDGTNDFEDVVIPVN